MNIDIINEGLDLNDDGIEFEGDGIVYNDELYTGIGYTLYNNGNLRTLAYYKDGFAFGICRSWYDDGQLSKEIELIHGQANGKETKWYHNGRIKSIAIYEFGIEVEYKKWDEEGVLCVSRTIDQNDSKGWYPHILKMREWNKGRYDNDLAFVLERVKDIF